MAHERDGELAARLVEALRNHRGDRGSEGDPE